VIKADFNSYGARAATMKLCCAARLPLRIKNLMIPPKADGGAR